MAKSIKKYIKRVISSYWYFRVKLTVGKIGKNCRINAKSIVTRKTYLGNNVNFNGMRIAGGGMVEIGDNFHSGKECLIITQNHNYDQGSKIPYDETFVYKDVIIKDNVWIGDRVIILGGTTIEEGAIIQAGSVVVNDIPKGAIAGGHPAKVFKYRDMDHYNELKSKKLFF